MGLEEGGKIQVQAKCIDIIFNKIRAEIFSCLGKERVMHVQKDYFILYFYYCAGGTL
jgi:hypothetical protein